ncbi:hypothetical protein RHGRI_008846 [Rhododendron griersonianum]|uniref:Gamma-glutamylcyclotransferase family protein n=1 Tax=Rhododendron griersonianum TaxID=479676 RepID=A0AAV6L3M8_9ERIC|nr:hypothetical protein RHGRI_008846 [Rhododendron griersonianum]
MGAAGKEEEKQALIFTYGTLKKGFSNHGLLENMFATGDASYLGPYTTLDEFPLLCGPFKVPFLLNFPGSGHRISGELYAVSPVALARMDELEGTTKGHYERLPVKVEPIGGGEGEKAVMRAEAYYAHRSFAEEMRRGGGGEEGNGGAFFGSYTEKEAEGYVKRADRPQRLSFLDQIRLFISSPANTSNSYNTD